MNKEEANEIAIATFLKGWDELLSAKVTSVPWVTDRYCHQI